MKKTFKKLFISLALCLTMCCTAVGVAFSGIFTAPVTTASAQELEGFQVWETAAVRKTNPNGIRFTAEISDAAKATVSQLNNVTYGTIILPADFLGTEELTLETDKIVNIVTNKWKDNNKYQSVLAGKKNADGTYSNLSTSYYNRPLAARGYATGTDAHGNTVTYYTTNTAVRSIGYVAYMAKAKNDTSDLIQDIVDLTKDELVFNETAQISAHNSDNEGAVIVENALPKSTNTAVTLKIGGIAVPDSEVSITYTPANTGVISANGETLTAVSAGETSVTATCTYNNKNYEVSKTISTDVYTPVASQYKILVSAKTVAHNKTAAKMGYLPQQTVFDYESYYTYAYEYATAYKLQDIIYEATGILLEVVEEGSDKDVAGNKYISIGKTQLAKTNATALGMTYVNYADDLEEGVLAGEYKINDIAYKGAYKFKGESYNTEEEKLLGKDTASKVQTVGDHVFLIGVTGQGTYYGAQQFLRAYAGYEYYMEDTYVVDDKVDFVLPTETLVYIPDVEHSVTQGEANNMHIDYALRSYTEEIIPVGTTDEQDANGYYYRGIGHNSGLVVSANTVLDPDIVSYSILNGKPNYRTDNVTVSSNKWAVWYATNDATTSVSFSNYRKYQLYAMPAQPYTGSETDWFAAELCYTAHGDYDSSGTYSYANLVETVASAMYAKMQKFPSFERIGFSQMDHNFWCQCKGCTAQGNPADNLLEFLLDVAANLKTKLTDAGDARAASFKISTLFYHKTAQAPENTANYSTKLENYMKHIEPWFAETKVDHVDPYNRADVTVPNSSVKNNWNSTVYNHFLGWTAIAKQYGSDMLLWEYYVNTTCFFQPYDTINSLRVNYGIFADEEIDYIFNQMMEGKNTWKRLKQFLVSQLEWNAHPTFCGGDGGSTECANDSMCEWHTWMNEYFEGAYGAGAEAMKTYFNSMHDWSEDHKDDFRADNAWTDGDAVNVSLTFDTRSSTYYSRDLLVQWIGQCDAALNALDPADPNYDIYYSNIMLEKLSPLYLLMYIYDDAPVATSTTVTYKNSAQANETLTYDKYAFANGADTSEVQEYGEEFVKWARRWSVTNYGEGKYIHNYYSYTDYTENTTNGKWTQIQAGFIPAIEALLSLDGTAATTNVQYVNETQYVTNTDSTSITNALLTEGSYDIYVGGRSWKSTISVSNGTATFDATDRVPGNSYALSFKGANGTIVFTDVFVATGTVSAEGNAPATSGYYFIDKDYYIEIGATETWLNHNVLTKGDYTITVNGNATSTTVFAAGKLKIKLNAPAIEGESYLVEVSNGTNTYAFMVYSATFIRTAEELKALGVGGKATDIANDYKSNANSDVAGNDVTGLYALANDIDCTDVIFSAGYNNSKSYFKATIDGNGYVIKNASVNEGGIFGGMYNATVKNMKFEDVIYADNKGNYAGNYSNYTALFAHSAINTTFENIEIEVKEAMHEQSWVLLDGLFVASTQKNVSYTNVTVNSQGLASKTLLGSNIQSVTYNNVVIRTGSYVAIGYTANEFKPDNSSVQNTDALITEKPAGVTIELITDTFNITNEEETVGIGVPLNITTNNANLTYSYSLKKAVTGVSVSDAGVVTVSEGAILDTTFTVVVTGSNYQVQEITFTVAKAQKTFSDVPTFEQPDGEFTLPSGIEGTVLKITIGGEVVYDSVNAIGGLNGTTVTFGENALTKQSSLGKGVEMLVETATTVYTGSANAYTMIIDNKAELDQWQAVAAENAVKAGLCIEAQKGITYSGYFLLNADIEYNGTWTPYKAYGGLWALFYNNANIWTDSTKTALVDGAFQEDWGQGEKGGFKGVFDGDGHYINGMETSGEYSAFVVTMGGGTIKNVAFTNAKIGASASLVADRGNGAFENIYVQVASMESGTTKAVDTQTVVLMRNRNTYVSTEGMTNVLVDVSAIDYASLSWVYVANLATVNNNIYVVGMPEGITLQATSATEAPLVFLHCNSNAGNTSDYDAAGAYVDTAALFADETHGPIAKAWDSEFWAIDAENNILIPARLVMEMQKPAIIPETTGQSVISVYEGNVQSLGFKANTYVSQVEITNGWSSRVKIATDNVDAGYISIDFALAQDSTVTSFMLWPGNSGSIPINANGVAYNEGAVTRKIVILDADGNDATKGPWTPGEVYTLKYYFVGEEAAKKYFAISTFNVSNTIYFANGKSGIVLDETIDIVASSGSFELPEGIEGNVKSVYLEGVQIFTGMDGANVLINTESIATDYAMHGENKSLQIYTTAGEYELGANVITKVITTAAELQALGVGGRTTDGNGYTDQTGYDVYGYYVLGNDIDGTGLYFAAGYSGQQSWFQATFDGRNHTVSNVIVSEGGIFGGMKDATIKNVNFTGVRYHDNVNGAGQGYNGNKQWGQYFGLLGQWARNINVENINVQISELNSYWAVGLLVYRGYEGSVNNFSNINVNASGLTFLNVLETHYGQATMNYNNVVIKAAGYDSIALVGEKGSEKITEWPTGVTFKAAGACQTVPHPNGNGSANGETLPIYAGDETTLGFAEGTTVYEHTVPAATSNTIWSVMGSPANQVRLTKCADEDYASVQFVLGRKFNTEVSSSYAFFSWIYGMKDGAEEYAAGGWLCQNGTTAASSDANFSASANGFAYKVFDVNGYEVKGTDCLAANTVYTLRVYGTNVVKVNLAVYAISGEAMTIYFANPSSGNENPVYDYNGNRIAWYKGDVEDVGFAEGTDVYQSVQDNRTSMWNPGTELGLTMERQTILIEKAADEEYASIQFSLSRELTGTFAFTSWWYDEAGANKGLAGYLKIDGNAHSMVDGLNVVAYDMEGNVATSFAANTVYELRWYGEGATAFKIGCCEQNGESITVYYANPSSSNAA